LFELEEIFYMKLVYGACVYLDPEGSGAYSVVVPDLPGCTSGGNSLAEALEMAVDAASGWVLDELEDDKSIPPASPLSKIKPDTPEGFVSALVLDMDSYAEKYGNKAIRKNVTIPNWLNTKAEKAGINFSQVLKDALENLLSVS
jgi:predicted RNase H-like HicB family nuclease